MIQELKPSQINFKAISRCYEKFRKLGGQRHTIIIQELRRVEQKVLNDLQNFRKTLDDPEFINLSGVEIEENLHIFHEAVELERHLGEIYS